tara:strand:+ start:141 stop:326 length:186 start_codon:yes stop_codon:yes gene_type:complete
LKVIVQRFSRRIAGKGVQLNTKEKDSLYAATRVAVIPMTGILVTDLDIGNIKSTVKALGGP